VEIIDARISEMAAKYRTAYPSAMKCLATDAEGLTTYLRFPAEHHHRVRHSNFIERTFGETRRRPKVIGRLPGETSCLTLVWAVLDRASRGWRGLTMTSDGLRLLQDLRRSLLEPPRQLRPRTVIPAQPADSPARIPGRAVMADASLRLPGCSAGLAEDRCPDALDLASRVRDTCTRWWPGCSRRIGRRRGRRGGEPVGRIAGLLGAAALMLLAGACTPGSSARPSAGKGAAVSRAVTPKNAAALAREGLLVPATYQQACANEGSICLTGGVGSVPAGPIPAVLNRPLHFPALRPGQRCPASRGSPVSTDFFRGIALGSGPVRVIVAENTGDVRHGVASLISPTSVPPWLGLKTLWFSVPAYQGPFVIRAERLGHPGPVALGEGPTVAPLVVPPGPTLNGSGGWRTAPGGLWVRAPGCYAWQVDGMDFSEIITVRAVLP